MSTETCKSPRWPVFSMTNRSPFQTWTPFQSSDHTWTACLHVWMYSLVTFPSKSQIRHYNMHLSIRRSSPNMCRHIRGHACTRSGLHASFMHLCELLMSLKNALSSNNVYIMTFSLTTSFFLFANGVNHSCMMHFLKNIFKPDERDLSSSHCFCVRGGV